MDTATPRGWLRALYDWATGTATPPPSHSPSLASSSREGVPARIGHYAIDRKLGQGGMGVVYAARDERLERTVALKMMSSLSDDDTARRRFWREARAAASVNHPNICQLYEIGEDGGELFIAMELLEGEALGTRLRRGPLTVSEAVPIGLAVLAALSALHARGIVHRDLKPSNVFLTPHGVKLLDFGLARPADPALARSLDSDAPLTQTGMLIGSPGYMAPEQFTGEGLDARTDVFAVGAILFEMLAGRPAFGGHNVIDTLHATLHEQPPALSGSPAVAAVDRVIRRALAKRPAERPPSAEALAKELLAVRPEGRSAADRARGRSGGMGKEVRYDRPDQDAPRADCAVNGARDRGARGASAASGSNGVGTRRSSRTGWIFPNREGKVADDRKIRDLFSDRSSPRQASPRSACTIFAARPAPRRTSRAGIT